MKIKKYIFIVMMLLITPFFGYQVMAHPPVDMSLDYDIDTDSLIVTITHETPAPDLHYVNKIDIKKNDVLLISQDYTSQPTNDIFSYTFNPDASIDDILMVTAYCNIQGSITRELTVTDDSENKPPKKPTINGETNGKTGVEYEYSFTSIDPEGDDVYYCIQWGDDLSEICIGPFQSGTEQKAKHTWTEKGTYTIKVKARDINEAESDWSTLTVSMPKNNFYNPILSRLFEHYSNIITIIKNLIGSL